MWTHPWLHPSCRTLTLLLLIASVYVGIAEPDCEFGHLLPCCELSGSFQKELLIAKNRSANNPDTMIRMIANAEPMGPALRITDLSDTPTGNDPSRLQFLVSLDILRLFDIDQKAQKYQMKYELSFRYRDCRAVFSDALGFKTLYASRSSSVWPKLFHPTYDIFERLDEAHDANMQQMTIASDGSVVYSRTHASEMACSFDFAEMPFDEQECSINIIISHGGTQTVEAAWNHNRGGLEHQADERNGVTMHSDVKPPEWKVSYQSNWQLSSEGAKELRTTLTAKFKLKRESWYSVSNYIIPSILYWLSSWLGLWINPDAVPARAAIGVIPVLVMTNKMNSLAAALPPISQTNRLQSFMLMSLIVVTLQMLEYGVCHTAGRLKVYLQKSFKSGKDDKKRTDVTQDLETVVAASSVDTTIRKLQEKELAIAKQISVWIDIHSRWIFFVVYVFAAIACLYF